MLVLDVGGISRLAKRSQRAVGPGLCVSPQRSLAGVGAIDRARRMPSRALCQDVPTNRVLKTCDLADDVPLARGAAPRLGAAPRSMRSSSPSPHTLTASLWNEPDVESRPLTPAHLRLLHADLAQALDQAADSVIVYLLADGTAYTRKVWNIEKG